MPKVTFDPDNIDPSTGEIEVEPSAVEFSEEESMPDDLFRNSDVENIVKKRLKRERRTMREKLKGDDEFFQEAASSRGFDPDSTADDEEVQKLRQKVSRVDDLQSQLEEAQNRIQSARETELENQVLKTADGVPEDVQDVLLDYTKSRMTYDEDYGWVEQGEDGVNFEGGEAVGVERFMEKTRENKPTFFQGGPAKQGPDVSHGDTSASGTSGRIYSESEWTNKMDNASDLPEEEFTELKSALAEGRVR